MPNYIIAYHGGQKPETPEAGAEQRERWKTWLSDQGEAVINPGTPLGMSKIVTADGVSDGGGPDSLTGFSVVQADSLDDALDMAKACPFLEIGTLEVAEMMEMG